MNRMEHKAQAERLLALAGNSMDIANTALQRQDIAVGNCSFFAATAFATQAQVHATLATIPDPMTSESPF